MIMHNSFLMGDKFGQGVLDGHSINLTTIKFPCRASYGHNADTHLTQVPVLGGYARFIIHLFTAIYNPENVLSDGHTIVATRSDPVLDLLNNPGLANMSISASDISTSCYY